MTTLTLPKWTSEKPTKPGLYRFRGRLYVRGMSLYTDESPEWIYVMHKWRNPERPLIALTFEESAMMALEQMRGEWQGPIEVSE
jgi:hypothetical protein